MQTFEMVLMLPSKKLFYVLDDDVLRLPCLSEIGRAFYELISGIVLNMIARLLLAKSSAWSAGDKNVDVLCGKTKMSRDFIRSRDRQIG